MRTTHDTLATMFARPAPDTGDPPPTVAWVVFRDGTAYLSGPTDELPADADLDAVEAVAVQVLRAHGPVHAGGPAGDFSVSKLERRFPDEHVYFVTYDHPALISLVFADAAIEDLSAGLTGRSARDRDARDPEALVVRDFAGNERRSS